MQQSDSIPLSVELVPQPMWGKNVRKVVSQQTWKYLRHEFDLDHGKCKICKRKDREETLHLHEEWRYEASGCNRANVVHKPRLLSDNGSSYISGDLAEWLEDHGMDHLRGAPYHPQTQGKIERWHQTLNAHPEEPDPA